MFGTGKVVRGIQGRLQHAGGAAEIVRRSRNRSAVKQKAATLVPRIRAVSTATPTGTTSSPTRRAGYSTTAPAERGEWNWRFLALTIPQRNAHLLMCSQNLEKGTAPALPGAGVAGGKWTMYRPSRDHDKPLLDLEYIEIATHRRTVIHANIPCPVSLRSLPWRRVR